MNDKKNRTKDGTRLQNLIDRRSETSDPEENALLQKLQALDSLFAESKECPELFHQAYVKPLLDEGVSLDSAFDLLVAGAVRAN